MVAVFAMKALFFLNVSQEATMITLAAAASHSEILRTFSGNSSEAEIHLEIFLVRPVRSLTATNGVFIDA